MFYCFTLAFLNRYCYCSSARKTAMFTLIVEFSLVKKICEDSCDFLGFKIVKNVVICILFIHINLAQNLSDLNKLSIIQRIIYSNIYKLPNEIVIGNIFIS